MSGPIAKIIAFMLLAAASCASMAAQATRRGPVWETMAVREPDRQAQDDIAVSVREGVIYISTENPTTVKVFSILGQLITEKHIPAGTVRLTLNARGIYILKTDNTTIRINL